MNKSSFDKFIRTGLTIQEVSDVLMRMSCEAPNDLISVEDLLNIYEDMVVEKVMQEQQDDLDMQEQQDDSDLGEAGTNP